MQLDVEDHLGAVERFVSLLERDEVAFATSRDGKALMAGSSERWGEAAVVGGADPASARAAARRTAAFYTGSGG